MTRTGRFAFAASGAALLVAAALAGCAPAGPFPGGPGGTASSAGTWGPGGRGEPQLELLADGTLHGTDGCNSLGGRWEQRGADVEFVGVARTEMYCEGVDDWLGNLGTATVDGSTMHVFDLDGAQIGTLERQ
ncbi:MAG: META domain-containing protein [Microbacteriaceae bacterium]|nr:META domain-containing protein [Microbacteriaceae bacterium]